MTTIPILIVLVEVLLRILAIANNETINDKHSNHNTVITGTMNNKNDSNTTSNIHNHRPCIVVLPLVLTLGGDTCGYQALREI